LARWGLPVPLGGTSNHFRTKVLREIGGWDSYNVTEDADLGVRLRRRGLRAEPFASRTYEEAPPNLLVWMKQRTRWMKGWMQTYVVHSLDGAKLFRDFGWRVFAGFHVLIGGMILTAILHTVFLGVVLAEILFEGPAAFVPQDVADWISVLVLAVGYGGAGLIVVSGLLHIRAPRLIWAQLLLPAYWLLHSIAAIHAVYELVQKPTYWAKTEHGITRQKRGEPLLGRGGIGIPVPVRRRSG
jgi:cellulose synthase/poly-beta-1,6-N-acetylglucosamine synthase-like glycosyltransferase